jgi:hypothetical protein
VCKQEAEFHVYSSYDIVPKEDHPRHARYPMPMIRACTEHLAELLWEHYSPRAVTQWVILARPKEEARRG